MVTQTNTEEINYLIGWWSSLLTCPHLHHREQSTTILSLNIFISLSQSLIVESSTGCPKKKWLVTKMQLSQQPLPQISISWRVLKSSWSQVSKSHLRSPIWPTASWEKRGKENFSLLKIAHLGLGTYTCMWPDFCEKYWTSNVNLEIVLIIITSN